MLGRIYESNESFFSEMGSNYGYNSEDETGNFGDLLDEAFDHENAHWDQIYDNDYDQFNDHESKTFSASKAKRARRTYAVTANMIFKIF